ncbi:MAG: hypothetical protein Q4G28_02570 [Neisseria sp.]|nr:hypothetical protein [Neisseria sp.]
MGKTLLTLALCCIATSVIAQGRWAYITKSTNSGAVYIDTKTITNDSAWIKQYNIGRVNGRNTNAIAKHHFQCGKHTLSYSVWRETYADTGEVYNHGIDDKNSIIEIIPDTTTEVIYDYFCSHHPKPAEGDK